MGGQGMGGDVGDEESVSADERELDGDDTVVRHEEEVAGVAKRSRETGSVRAKKTVRRERVTENVPRQREEIRFQRVPAGEADSGEIETLPDGSVSIPVYEEELVVEKRTVLRERVIITKERITEREPVHATLRKERVAVEGAGGVDVEEPLASAAPGAGTETRPFFITSEFVAFLVVVAALVTTIALDHLETWLGLVLIVAAVVAYMLSRGFAKADSPRQSWDPRESLFARIRSRDSE